jgi:phenylacetate-CoA ligase
MYVLATLIEEAGLRLYNTPKYVVTGADALLPNYETVITRVFGAPVTEQYGMTEFAGNMSKCELGNFHLDFECCYAETQPEKNSGFDGLIMTGWGNLAMPFIRYQVGDYGLPMKQPCTCGRMSQSFTSIGGRLEDYVITPDGRKLIGMNQVFEYAKNAGEMQIYQKTCNEIEFRVIPKKGFGEEDKQALIREFRRRGGEEMHIGFAMVDRLERSSSGKLKAVISEVPQVDER